MSDEQKQPEEKARPMPPDAYAPLAAATESNALPQKPLPPPAEANAITKPLAGPRLTELASAGDSPRHQPPPERAPVNLAPSSGSKLSGPVYFDTGDPRTLRPNLPDLASRQSDEWIGEAMGKIDILQSQVASLQRQLANQQRVDVPAANPERYGIDPRFRVFMARTTDDPTTFIEQVVVNGALADSNAAQRRECDDPDAPQAIIQPDPDVVTLLEQEDFDGGNRVKRFVQITGGSAALIPVRLSVVGGSPGSVTTECSFIYNLLDYDSGDTLASRVSMTGHGQRFPMGVFTAGTIGIAFKDSDVWILIWADEQPVMSPCSGSAPIYGF